MAKPKKLKKKEIEELNKFNDSGVAKDTSPKVFQNSKMKDPVKIRTRDDLTEKQKGLLQLIKDKETKIIFLDGPAGTAKAQPLDAKILTPNGWTTMGEIKVGDEVISSDGNPTKVLGVFPQGEKEIYKVTFSDGSSTECCMEHLWITQSQEERNHQNIKRNGGNPIYIKTPKPPKIRTLKEIKESLLINNHLNHSIPITNPIIFKSRDHLIHPYLMGILIGDGCLVSTTPKITSDDEEIIDKIKTLIPKDIKINKVKEMEYSVTDDTATWQSPNRITKELKRLNLHNHKSYTKFIPDEYLFDSVENRIELLRGLMDSDGTVNKNHTSFCTVSDQLSKDIQFLIQTLGGTAIKFSRQTFYTYKGEKKKGAISYIISVKLNNEINPFFLKRKADKVIKRIKYFPIRYFSSIEFAGKKEAQCIRVENESHLYLTDDCIVTHNTYCAVQAGLELLNEKRHSDIMYLRSAVESSERSLGMLPGEANLKMQPYLEPLENKLEEFLDKPSIQKLKAEGRVSGNVINYLRGSSFNAKYIIVDEIQNLSFKEILTAITRLGKYSTMVLIGDRRQADIRNSGFEEMFKIFNTEKAQENGIFCLEFTKDDIVRSGIVKFIVEEIDNYKLYSNKNN